MIDQIGRELKSIRARKNLTLKEASEITGISGNTLCIYENNPKVIQLGKLFKILDSYEIDNDIFFKNLCEYIHINNSTEKEKE